LFNSAFNPSLVTYDGTYENSLHGSPRFQAYAQELADRLSSRFALRGRLVVEVGCGKGEFLRLLCCRAGARGLGIDESYDPSIAGDMEEDDSVTFVREPFSGLESGVRPAIIFCRHVLEHLPAPRTFVSELAAVARRSPDCGVFIEVPNVLYTLRDLGIWDLIYEHCLYFAAPALARLCESSGLRPSNVSQSFGDQYLCVEAIGTKPPAAFTPVDSEVRELSVLAREFGGRYRAKVAEWISQLEQFRAAGRRVVIWGAGSKGVTFANVVGGAERVACLVDVNPRKMDRFVPITGQPVVGPGTLAQLRPDVILVMNPLYVEEVEQQVRALDLNSVVRVA
jgi:hypothetical protein